MTKNTVIIGVAIVAGIISPEIEAQPKGRGDAPREEALKEPFKGVYYLDVPPANLFPIRKTRRQHRTSAAGGQGVFGKSDSG